MPRIPYVDPARLSPEDRAELLAGDYNAFRALANSPATCRAFRQMVYLLKRARLEPRLRELALLEAGWLSRCRYEWFHHVKTGMENGVSESDIRILMDGSDESLSRLDAAARYVVIATRQMHFDGAVTREVTDELVRRLGLEAFTDLLVAMGFYVGAVRVLTTLDLDLEPQYEPYLSRFPLPPAGG